MNTIAYIKERGWKALKEELGIKSRIYEKEGLVKLNYDQIYSPPNHPVVMECRGLILSYPDGEKVISRSFTRFFNLQLKTKESGMLDFKTLQFQEKLDGSMIQVYWWNGKWRISTMSMAFAEGQCNGFPSYYHAVLAAFGMEGEGEALDSWFDRYRFYGETGEVDTYGRNRTWVFEYIGPLNRIVTPYETAEMVLLAVFDNDTGEEIKRELEDYAKPWRLPIEYEFENEEELKVWIDTCETLEEGYVLITPDGTRYKVKTPKYLQTHHNLAHGGIVTKKQMLEMILSGDSDDFLAVFPEKREEFLKFNNEIDGVKETLLQEWTRYLPYTQDQKTFAEQIKNNKYKALLFTARKSAKNIVEVFDELPVDRKLTFL